jgi:drug/metabolite transporter (DMT)-like permease
VVGLIGEYLGACSSRHTASRNTCPRGLHRGRRRRRKVERPPVNTQAAGQPYRVPSPRSPTMMIYYVVLGIGILAGIAGQMLLKAGADAPTLVAQILRPRPWSGSRSTARRRSSTFRAAQDPVSVAFPSVSLSYAIVAVLGHFLFGEPFGIKQIGGIALIMGGVVLINQT